MREPYQEDNVLADTIVFALAYLTLGLLTCWVARTGWPDEWDEALLASVFGPPFMALVVTVFAVDVIAARLQVIAAIFTRRATARR